MPYDNRDCTSSHSFEAAVQSLGILVSTLRILGHSCEDPMQFYDMVV